MTTTLYGIRSCDTVRKARRWLEDQGVTYAYHDLRDDGLEAAVLETWIGAAGWQQVINRRSTSWKALDPAQREAMDAGSARDAAAAMPTLIKRPVLVTENALEFGFKPERYAAITG